MRLSLITLLLSFSLFSFIKSNRLPKSNRLIIEYVDSVINKKVGTGECADLIFNAQYYLKKNGIKLKSKPSKKPLPGDFISFKNVRTYDGITLLDHQAIIYKVLDHNRFIIAHQNHNNNKTVHKTTLNLNNLKQGKIEVRHP